MSHCLYRPYLEVAEGRATPELLIERFFVSQGSALCALPCAVLSSRPDLQLADRARLTLLPGIVSAQDSVLVAPMLALQGEDRGVGSWQLYTLLRPAVRLSRAALPLPLTLSATAGQAQDQSTRELKLSAEELQALANRSALALLRAGLLVPEMAGSLRPQAPSCPLGIKLTLGDAQVETCAHLFAAPTLASKAQR